MIAGLIFLFGLVIGSFLNVVIDRLPHGENIIWKPSHCDFCKKHLRWFELIPVLSFLFQGGVCRRCHARLSWQYPVMEIVTGVGFVLLSLHVDVLSPMFLAAIAIYSLFLVIFVIDLKHQIIPDSTLLMLLSVLIVVGVPFSAADRVPHIISGLGAGAFFFLLWLVTRGRGLGFGDVKLVVLIGLFLGYPETVFALYIAFLTGAIAGVILMITKHAKMKSRIAFGPFLILGTLSAYVWSDQLWQWWLGLFV